MGNAWPVTAAGTKAFGRITGASGPKVPPGRGDIGGMWNYENIPEYEPYRQRPGPRIDWSKVGPQVPRGPLHRFYDWLWDQNPGNRDPRGESRASKFGPIAWMYAGYLVKRQFQDWLDVVYMPGFVVPPGWEKVCYNGGFSGSWSISPQGCFGAGPLIGGNYGDPPPAGYWGYGVAPVPQLYGDGYWYAGNMGESPTLEPFPFQIFFVYASARYLDQGVTPSTLPHPGLVPVPGPQVVPDAEPIVETGPMARPFPPVFPWATPSPWPNPFPYPGVRHRYGYPSWLTWPVSPPSPSPFPGVPHPPKPPGDVDPPRGRARLPRVVLRRVPRTKPPRGIRERKWRPGRATQGLINAIGVATEFVDLFTATWWALPKKSRYDAFWEMGKNLNYMEKVAWTLSHSEEIDWPTALFNFAMQQAGDVQAASGGWFTKEMNQRLDSMGLSDLRSRGPIETWDKLRDLLGNLQLFSHIEMKPLPLPVTVGQAWYYEFVSGVNPTGQYPKPPSRRIGRPGLHFVDGRWVPYTHSQGYYGDQL